MRATLPRLLALLFTLPGIAFAASVEEQLRAAGETFLGSAENEAFWLNYKARVLDGIDGRWGAVLFDANGPKPPLDVSCTNQPFEARKVSDYAFTFTRMTKAGNVTFTYTTMGGNMFSEHVDSAEHLHWLGMDREGFDERQRTTSLNGIGGNASVYRPSADVLVIQTNYRLPRIFARCP